MKRDTIVEEFSTKEEREARFRELREKGHRPSKTSTTKPVKWEQVWQLSYSPGMRKRKKAVAA